MQYAGDVPVRLDHHQYVVAQHEQALHVGGDLDVGHHPAEPKKSVTRAEGQKMSGEIVEMKVCWAADRSSHKRTSPLRLDSRIESPRIRSTVSRTQSRSAGLVSWIYP